MIAGIDNKQMKNMPPTNKIKEAKNGSTNGMALRLYIIYTLKLSINIRWNYKS